MREIKFRAWDFYENKMSKPFGLDGSYHDGEIMQYTGLKDKNGKEIYEGDILRASDGSTLPPVEWVNGNFGYRNCMWHDKKEIIGNIYENPDLIK